MQKVMTQRSVLCCVHVGFGIRKWCQYLTELSICKLPVYIILWSTDTDFNIHVLICNKNCVEKLLKLVKKIE